MRSLRNVLALGALLSTAACGARSELPERAAGPCGNGRIDPGEQCDRGADNADRPAITLKQGTFSTWVKPIDRAGSVVAFYAYSSSSGHTGFEALGKSQLLLHRDVTTSLMTLVTEHGIDGDPSGPQQPPSHVTQSFAGLPPGVSVAFADDDDTEFHLGAPGTAQGDWKFHLNTDGGGLSGLPLPGNWTITVDSVFDAAIDTWRFLDPEEIPLTLTETAVLIASDQPSACRTDCTIPACGDGILDAGEVCDDGNTASGDGCSADCAALD